MNFLPGAGRGLHWLLACILVIGGWGGGTASPGIRVSRVEAPARLIARQALGQLLFFEPGLSANGKRSCASCHRPEKAFCDQRALPRALRFTENLDRNSPTLLNATGQATFFHDGRAGSLAEVLTTVLTSPREFGSSYAEATARLNTSPEYRRRFRRAFGPGAGIEPATLSAALAAYLGTLVGQAAPYDVMAAAVHDHLR
ncbi:MAG: cytochrome-c peroxidase [Hymenobacter sp.]|nr:cytochrome-c peroxidase [Hymenobacter sp.]